MNELRDLIQECQGIQPVCHAFYMEAIRFNIESAASSIRFVMQEIEELDECGFDHIQVGLRQNEVLDQIQNILIQAAALSRYFWSSKDGQYKVHKLRAKQLRETFKLSDASPLKNRELRNQLEHFDENLDTYLWEKPIVGRILPTYLGNQPDNEQVPYHLFRAYYLDTRVFETLGKRYELDPIIDELAKIYEFFTNDKGST